MIDWFESHPDSYSPERDIPASHENTIRSWRDYGVFHLPHGGGDAIGVVKRALETGNYPHHIGKHATNIACFGLFAARCNNGTVLINSNWCHADCCDVIVESERKEEGRPQTKAQAKFLIDRLPGSEDAYLLATATEIGLRISRTFTGRSVLGADAFKDGKRLPDVVGLVGEVDRRRKPYGLLQKAGNIPSAC